MTPELGRASFTPSFDLQPVLRRLDQIERELRALRLVIERLAARIDAREA
jgi:hypothetical protein